MRSRPRMYMSCTDQANRCIQPFIVFTALCWLVLFSMHAHAESRALLVGVGDYADETVSDLPGIDIDINIMQRVARNLGYDESAIRVLFDSEATLENINRSITEWLVEGVGPDDQVLIYLSGHGSQLSDSNGDESDGMDEFFLAHDFRIENNTAYGALLDDHFYAYLNRIPTENILLIVDACHSGTGFKSYDGTLSGVDHGVVKYHHTSIKSNQSMQVADGIVDAGFAMGEKGYDDRFVAMMAAQDDEYAIATSRGGVFTLGVEQAIKQALAQNRRTTPASMIAPIREFVKTELASRPDLVFTPQIGGASDLINKPLQLVVKPSFRDRLMRVVKESTPLRIASNKRDYPLEDRSMRVSVNVPADGYLNIINVNSQDSAVILFPNYYNRDNKVNRGSVSIPTPQMDFDLVARPPMGESLFVAIWTPKKINMYEEGKGHRVELDGKLPAIFHEVSEYSATRNFGIEARRNNNWHAGAVTVNVVP